MNESVCNFGPDDGLFGILTTPDDDVKVHGSPIALILNAGIVHRVGPFRLHVDLARQLALQGFSTLRLDLSGLGDSAPRPGKIKSEDRALADVRDAMDHLGAEYGTETFTVLGLCSGAYEAHRVAIQDERIVGSVFMDGIVFRTLGFYLRNQARFFKPRFWRNAVKRRLLARERSDETDGQSLAESEFFGGDLCRQTVTDELKHLMKREVQMLFLYTEGYDDICSSTQFKEMYGLQPNDAQIQVEYFDKAEHTFRLIENRQIAVDRIAGWYQDRFAKQVLEQLR